MKMVMANTIEAREKRIEKVLDCREMMRRCGANTGNVCFVDALYDQIQVEKEVWCTEIEPENKEELFILPASNWINVEGKVLQRIFLRLDRVDVRFLVIGLGIQMELGQSISELVKGLSEKTITALKIMSEHSVSIGIRGERTAEVLDRLSIHNWQIIGCPSFYEPYRKNQHISCRETFGETICYNTKPGGEREHKLIEMAALTSAPLILQAMGDLPLTLTEGKRIEKAVLEDKYPGLKMTANELETYIQNHGHIFFARNEWSEFLVNNSVALSVGGRFHGNMMAFSNGIPALWLVCDERIKEMVDAMKLPFIFYEKLDDIHEPEEFFGFLNYDSEFQNHYQRMADNYIDFLNKNQVRHTFKIRR